MIVKYVFGYPKIRISRECMHVESSRQYNGRLSMLYNPVLLQESFTWPRMKCDGLVHVHRKKAIKIMRLETDDHSKNIHTFQF